MGNAQVLVNNLVVRVNHVVSTVRASARSGLVVLVGVDDLGQLVARLLQLLGSSLDGLDVGALEGLLGVSQSGLDVSLGASGNLVAKLLEGLLGGVGQAVGLVADLDLVLLGLVLLGVGAETCRCPCPWQ